MSFQTLVYTIKHATFITTYRYEMHQINKENYSAISSYIFQILVNRWGKNLQIFVNLNEKTPIPAIVLLMSTYELFHNEYGWHHKNLLINFSGHNK